MDDRLERNPRAIRAMFAGVAARYDLLNRLLSLRRDVAWRRLLVAAVAGAPVGPVLDLATGTGDVALGVADRTVIGADFTMEMLALAGGKAARAGRHVAWVAADALALPWPDATFAAVTIAFGVRNFADLGLGLGEMHRVLAPGGLMGILELHRPRWAALALLVRVWNTVVVRQLGRVLSDEGGAYSYLPASIETFPDRPGLAARIAGCGFEVVQSCDLSGGIAALTVARRVEAE